MKKLFFTCMAFAAFTSLTQAQPRFGIKAGTNFANLHTHYADDGDEDETSDTKTGLHAGAFVTLPVSAKFSVQPEADYSTEGGKDKESGLKFNLSFINIPVLAQYNASGFVVETGPQLGLLVAAKAKLGDAEQNMKEYFKSTAISWVLGAGYRFSNGIGFHARYDLGLSHLMIGDTREGKLTSRVFQFGLSLLLGSGKAVGK